MSILLLPGPHRGPLVVRKAVHLVGALRATLEGVGNADYVITCTCTCEDSQACSTLDGLVIRGTGLGRAYYGAVLVRGGCRVRIQNCDITSSAPCLGAKGSSVYVLRASPILVGCGVHDSDNGVRFKGGTTRGEVRGCTLARNRVGLAVVGGAAPSITGCVISDSARDGVALRGAGGRLEGCTIVRSGGWGVGMSAYNNNLFLNNMALANNTFEDNRRGDVRPC